MLQNRTTFHFNSRMANKLLLKKPSKKEASFSASKQKPRQIFDFKQSVQEEPLLRKQSVQNQLKSLLQPLSKNITSPGSVKFFQTQQSNFTTTAKKGSEEKPLLQNKGSFLRTSPMQKKEGLRRESFNLGLAKIVREMGERKRRREGLRKKILELEQSLFSKRSPNLFVNLKTLC